MKTALKLNLRQIVFVVLAIVFFAGTFAVVRYVTVTMEAVPGIPGVAISNEVQATPVTGALATLAPDAPAVPLPPTWDGASRVTILLIGVDTEVAVDREGKVSPDRIGPARSDTMILLTIDPQTKTAGMMSIPRDLWVNIPGFDYAKINTAYYNGDAFKVPGGGPELAMRTVEQVVGVPVQYFAQVEFAAFTAFIDLIDKVEVKVEKKIIIDPVGPGSDKIMLSAGMHKLGGVEALAYVRQRHTEGGDVDRSKRQQAVIMAIRDKVLNPVNFPTMLANAPAIYNEIQAGVKTNLTFDEIMRLGMLAKDIAPENIKRGVIDYTMVLMDNVVVNGENQSIFKPIPEKIRELRDTIFSSAGAVSPLAQGDLLELAKQEGATIAVYNGSGVTGMAQRTTDYLKSLGLNVILTDNAGYSAISTQVINQHGKLYALKYFQDLFQIKSGGQISNQYDPAAVADIKLIVGEDWATNPRMP
jgi:LCP family protein required for cell wall assembly